MVFQTLFKLEDVSFSYDRADAVLSGINLTVNKHDLLVVKGESGAGKSTFLKLFNRFCDNDGGTILFHDRDIRDYKIDEIRKSVIYLPQLPYLIDGSVEDNLRFPFAFQIHKDMEYDPQKAGEWLDYFQLNISPSNSSLRLSIGQKQRISLIRAMLLEPEIILLDEPGSALDVLNKRLIEQKIESLVGSSEITAIMVTHSEVSFSHGGYRELVLENRSLQESCKAE